jgi:hypothetical protein
LFPYLIIGLLILAPFVAAVCQPAAATVQAVRPQKAKASHHDGKRLRHGRITSGWMEMLPTVLGPGTGPGWTEAT